MGRSIYCEVRLIANVFMLHSGKTFIGKSDPRHVLGEIDHNVSYNNQGLDCWLRGKCSLAARLLMIQQADELINKKKQI